MGQKEGPLTFTKIDSSSKYKSEGKTSTNSVLSLYTFSQLIPPPSSLLLPLSYTMSQQSQINYELLAQQQQEQLIALQTQVQALLAAQGGGVVARMGTSTEVAKPQIFDRSQKKVLGFIMVCKLYIRMKIRGEAVEEQIQWVLLYM